MQRLALVSATVLLCATQSFAAGRALLQTNGVVLVNGAPMRSGGSLRPGDILATGERSAALITEGSQVQVAPRSMMEHRAGYVRLFCGSLSVKTSTGIAVRFATITAWPAQQGKSQFQVRFESGSAEVTPLGGSLWVNDGGKASQSLAQGSSMRFSLPVTESGTCPKKNATTH